MVDYLGSDGSMADVGRRVRTEDDCLCMSPDGRFILWHSDGLTLSCVGSPENDVTALLPEGYRLVPPETWPGNADHLAVYAQGRDCGDSLLLIYEFGAGKLALAASLEPPSPDLAFDTTIEPVLIGEGAVSVVVVDRVMSSKGLTAEPSTWIALTDHTGGF